MQVHFSNVYRFTTDAADMARKMPMLLRIKESMIKFFVFIFEIPIKLTPNSSGKGDAMINAPITGSVQLKYLV